MARWVGVCRIMSAELGAPNLGLLGSDLLGLTQPTLGPRQGWTSVADTPRILTVLFVLCWNTSKQQFEGGLDRRCSTTSLGIRKSVRAISLATATGGQQQKFRYRAMVHLSLLPSQRSCGVRVKTWGNSSYEMSYESTHFAGLVGFWRWHINMLWCRAPAGVK